MGQLHPDLEAVPLTPWGDKRFYPPGEHPATYRYKAHREALLRLPASAERDQMVSYVDGLLAAFEQGESEAKQQYLRIFDDRRERYLREQFGDE